MLSEKYNYRESWTKYNYNIMSNSLEIFSKGVASYLVHQILPEIVLRHAIPHPPLPLLRSLKILGQALGLRFVVEALLCNRFLQQARIGTLRSQETTACLGVSERDGGGADPD